MASLVLNSNKNAKSGPQGAPGPPAQDEKKPNEAPRSDIAPNAEVWKKYVEETDKYDKDLVDGWNNSLDMLLLFAALFSAISAAFVLESTQDLKPDYAEASAQTLASILQAISSGSPANSSSLPSADQAPFSPSSAAVTVNILWFMSLSLSVAVALVAIVAKDWCYQFMSGRNGAFLSQGRRRQLRWEGIEQWRMQEMLNVLPLMMHAALLLFAAGLILYLWDLNPRVALPVLVTTVIVGLFYLITLFLPLFFRYCPFTTGLIKLFLPYWYTIARSTLEKFLQAIGALLILPTTIITLISRFSRQAISYSQKPGSQDREAGFVHWIAQVSFKTCWSDSTNAINERVERLLSGFMDDRSQLDGQEAPMDDVTSSMLGWMIIHCEDSSSASAAYRALVCAKPWIPRQPLVKSGALEATVTRLNAHMMTWDEADRTNDENNRRHLKPIVLLLSQSLSVISHMEELVLPDGYLGSIYWICPVLDHAWNSRDESGHDLAVKEIGSLSLHITNEWKFSLDARKQLDIQKTLLEEFTTGKTASISPEEICHLIDGVAKSYLYVPDQPPNSLVKLLNMSEYQNHRQLRRAAGVALIVAYIANYDHPESSPAPDPSARLKRAKKLYLELSTMCPDDHPIGPNSECGQLLLFGLTAFSLADPNPTWGLNSRSLADTISVMSKDVSIINAHPKLGLSPLEIMAKWLLAMRPAGSQGPASSDIPPKQTEVAINMPSDSPTIHSGPMADAGDFGTTQEPPSEPAYLERARHILQLLRSESVIYKSMEGYYSSSSLDKLIEIKVHERIYRKIGSESGDVIPHCMSFLWMFTRSILAISRKPYNPGEIDARSILNPLRAHQESIPKDMTDMEFAESWIDKLKAACERNPQNVLDSKILDKMIKYYKSGAEYYDTSDTDDANETDETNDEPATQPNPTNGPDSETRRTWLEVLEGLAKTCREKAQAPNSDPPLEHGTNADPVEESRVGEKNEEELIHGGEASRPIDKPIDSMEGAVEAGRLPPEVLEYVPYPDPASDD